MSRVLIDCDGVLVESIGQDWFNWLKRNFQFKKEFAHLITENYKTVKLPYNLSTLFHTGDFHTGFEYWNDEFLYDSYTPLKDTQKCLDLLHIKGYDIVVVSKVIGNHYQSKERFIKKYFPYAKFVVTEDKYLVNGTFFIDDSIAMINKMSEETKVILYRRDYQQTEEVTRKDCMIAYDFNDVYNLIVGD